MKATVQAIGIDVSKCKLDLAIKLSDLSYRESSFANDQKGISALCSFLKQQEAAIPDFTGNIELIKARKLASFLASLEKTKQQLSASLKRFEETAKIIGLRHSVSPASKALKEIDQQMARINRELTDLLPEKIAELAVHTAGLSQEKLAVIYALIGDKAFATEDQLVAFLGLDIAVRQSGKWRGQGKLSKRGNAYARKILYQIAWGLKTHNEIFKDYYRRMRARGKHYTTTLMAVARKFLRYYFAYCFKGTVKLY